jgi:hypothetical protein
MAVVHRRSAAWFVTADGYPYGMLSGYQFSEIPTLLFGGQLLDLEHAAITALTPRAVRRGVRLALAASVEMRKGWRLGEVVPFSATLRRGILGRRRMALVVGEDEVVTRHG